MNFGEYRNISKLAKELFKEFDIEYAKHGWSEKAKEMYKAAHEEALLGGVE